jgi:cytochrome c oxidase subunit 4
MHIDQGSSTSVAQAHNSANMHKHGHVHVVSPKLLLTVYGILLVLTVLTVSITSVNLGNFNLAVALLIAVAKASVVALYFMHLRWDSPFNAIALIAAFFFVAIFIGISMLDSHEYKGNYTAPGGGQVLLQHGQ